MAIAADTGAVRIASGGGSGAAGREGQRSAVQGQQPMAPEGNDHRPAGSGEGGGSRHCGPVTMSSTFVRLRQFAMVLELMPSFAAIDPPDQLLIARTPGSAARALRPALEPMAPLRLDRGAAMTNLSHRVSCHSKERITPSNRGHRTTNELGNGGISWQGLTPFGLRPSVARTTYGRHGRTNEHPKAMWT